MSKTRACYNCLHYEQAPMDSMVGNSLQAAPVRGFAPRCTKGLNPSLAHAPIHMPTRWDGKFEPDTMAAFCDSYLWAPVNYPRLRKVAKMRLTKEPRYTTADLAEQFLQYYEQGESTRVKIERGTNFKYTEYGYVAQSSGYQPVFLLMKSSKAKGSSVCLNNDDFVVAVKGPRDKRYKPR